MNEADNFPYIAFLKLSDTAEPERLEYAFHTFSLRNVCCYVPTLDVTFASPNPDASMLDGGVERLVNAVLLIDATAKVLPAADLRQLLDAIDDGQIDVGKGIVRDRTDLEALYKQALTAHSHEH